MSLETHKLKGGHLMQVTVKQARVGANLTQAVIAEKMNVHPTTYLRMEKHPEDMTMKRFPISLHLSFRKKNFLNAAMQ